MNNYSKRLLTELVKTAAVLQHTAAAAVNDMDLASIPSQHVDKSCPLTRSNALQACPVSSNMLFEI